MNDRMCENVFSVEKWRHVAEKIDSIIIAQLQDIIITIPSGIEKRNVVIYTTVPPVLFTYVTTTVVAQFFAYVFGMPESWIFWQRS